MAGELLHFELPAEDAQRAKRFWSSLFGWKFQEWSGPMEYHMTEGLQPGGAIYPSDSGGGDGPIVYFGSEELDATLARVAELGGTVELEKQPIPGVGWFGRCRDTEGNRFSVFQSDESVPMPDQG